VEHFTPYSALLGGALIGLSASLLLLASGRIAGISGILGGALASPGEERWWRVLFLAGLIGGCLVVRYLSADAVPVSISASPFLLVIAGLLVGYGTRQANGCTSGHGVCGIARLSPRSIAATMTFMACGALTVFLMRHVFGA
jgi:uncharacterized membrane protein YedE/YeeE